MDEDLDAETGAVGDREHPNAIVRHRLFEDGPAALLAGVNRNAARTKLGDVALGRVLREAVIQECHDQHHDAGHDHRQAPAHRLLDADADEGRQNQRHHALGDTAAGIAPAADRGVGRTDPRSVRT